MARKKTVTIVVFIEGLTPRFFRKPRVVNKSSCTVQIKLNPSQDITRIGKEIKREASLILDEALKNTPNAPQVQFKLCSLGLKSNLPVIKQLIINKNDPQHTGHHGKKRMWVKVTNCLKETILQVIA